MTFDELVVEVSARLNLVSAEAMTRIGREINVRYREVTGELGLQTSRRTTVSQDTTIGDRFVTFHDVEKLYDVFDDEDPPSMLTQVTFTELRDRAAQSGDLPKDYAVAMSDARSVTIFLDKTPETAYTLNADAQSVAAVLADEDEPAFPESFHDVLIEGVIAVELRKQEKRADAKDAQEQFEKRLAALRLHLRSSATLAIQQNRLQQPYWAIPRR